MNKIYRVILVQFTDALSLFIKGEEYYDEKADTYDPIFLLKMVNNISSGVESKTNKILALWVSLVSFINIHQGGNRSNSKYLDFFKSSL